MFGNLTIPFWANVTARVVVGEEGLVSAAWGLYCNSQLEWVLTAYSVQVLD